LSNLGISFALLKETLGGSMNKSSLIPLLLLSTACFKQQTFQTSSLDEIKVSRQNDSLFSLIETPTFHATFASSSQNPSFIDLKSMTKKELSSMSFWLAEKAFKNNRLDILQAIILGTPLIGLQAEDQRNLHEQLKSLERADIQISKDSGFFELYLKSKRENLNLDYYLLDQFQMKKIGETSSQSSSDQKNLLNVKILDTKEVLKGLSAGKVIFAVPKDSLNAFNLFISNGEQFRAYNVDREAPLVETLKLIDPKVSIRGSAFIERFLEKESSSSELWQSAHDEGNMFLVFQKGNDFFSDNEVIIDKQTINTGAEKNLLIHHHHFSVNEKLHLSFEKMTRQKQAYIENTYYAQELCARAEYRTCTALQLTPIGWKNYSVNSLTDLNVNFYFKDKLLPVKPLFTYEYVAGKKTETIKRMEVEIQFDQELFASQRSFEIRLGDKKARILSMYSGCLADNYPQYVRNNPRYSDFNNAQFELTMDVGH
jgi:hypothetical protein